MKPNRVFVYGTLKTGNTTRGMQYFEGAEFLGEAITLDANFDIVDLERHCCNLRKVKSKAKYMKWMKRHLLT